MKEWTMLTGVAVLALAGAAAAAESVVPAGLESVPGNTSNVIPFDCAAVPGATGMRYQQVYRGSEVGDGTIAELRFRLPSSGTGGFGPVVVPGVEIVLSRTTAVPDALSPTFDDNLETDPTIVFAGDLTLSGTDGAGWPEPFSIAIPLQTPYAFSGATSNLLIDVRIPQCASTEAFEAHSDAGDGVSRIWSEDPDAAVADQGDTVGLVTQFVFTEPAACTSEPLPDCAQSAVSILVARDMDRDRRDALVWAWVRGDTALDTLVDPRSATSYAFCVHDDGGLASEIRIPAGGTCERRDCWRPFRAGFVYRDRAARADGARALVLRAHENGRARMVLRAAGVNLAVPSLPISGTVTTQLVSSTGACWEATFSQTRRNDNRLLRAVNR